MVLSDMGGVVMQIDFRRVLRHWSTSCGKELHTERVPIDEAYEAFETGRMHAEEYFRHLGTHLDVDLPHEAWVAGWNDLFVGVDQQALDILARVRDAGHRVVAVTNTNLTHEEHWRARFSEFDAAFDHIYSSARLGERKPYPAFYTTVLEAEGAGPSDAFFIDDLEANVKAARAVGVPSHHFLEDHAALESDLAGHGFLSSP